MAPNNTENGTAPPFDLSGSTISPQQLAYVFGHVPWVEFNVTAKANLNAFTNNPAVRHVVGQVAQATVKDITDKLVDDLKDKFNKALQQAIRDSTDMVATQITDNMNKLFKGLEVDTKARPFTAFQRLQDLDGSENSDVVNKDLVTINAPGWFNDGTQSYYGPGSAPGSPSVGTPWGPAMPNPAGGAPGTPYIGGNSGNINNGGVSGPNTNSFNPNSNSNNNNGGPAAPGPFGGAPGGPTAPTTPAGTPGGPYLGPNSGNIIGGPVSGPNIDSFNPNSNNNNNNNGGPAAPGPFGGAPGGPTAPTTPAGTPGGPYLGPNSGNIIGGSVSGPNTDSFNPNSNNNNNRKTNPGPTPAPDVPKPVITVPDLVNGTWIWTPELPYDNPPQQPRGFRKTMTLPTGKVVDSLIIDVTCDNFETVYVNGFCLGFGLDFRFAKRWSITFPPTNKVVIAVYAANDPISKNVAGLIAAAVAWNSARFQGETFKIQTDATWKCTTTTPPRGFENPTQSDRTWGDVRVIGPFDIPPWTVLKPTKVEPITEGFKTAAVNGIPDAPKAPLATPGPDVDGSIQV